MQERKSLSDSKAIPIDDLQKMRDYIQGPIVTIQGLREVASVLADALEDARLRIDALEKNPNAQELVKSFLECAESLGLQTSLDAILRDEEEL